LEQVRWLIEEKGLVLRIRELRFQLVWALA
jgi:hypothetical protein